VKHEINECKEVLDDVIIRLRNRFKIPLNVKFTNIYFRGLIAYVSLIEVLFGKCNIYITPDFIKASSNCLNISYVEYILAHEVAHCKTFKYILMLIALTIAPALLFLICYACEDITTVIILLLILRTLHYLRLINEYLADREVLRVYRGGYIDFLRTLEYIENLVPQSKSRKLFMKILGQPSVSERIAFLTKPTKLIIKYFVP